MVIFMPIYLHQYIGFSWTEISVIFSIMLLPFVLFEIPAGWLADKWCGEKEIMTIGLFVMGFALLCIPFIKSPDLMVWAIILFFSRVGASIVEIACESYFFKHVDKRDTGLISIFRLSGPVAYIIGPTLGAFSLALFPYPAVFLILSILVLGGMAISSKLKDTL
jgi:MFS family permease